MPGPVLDSSITVRRQSTAVLVHLRGEIDISLKDDADRALVDIVAAELPVVLDLAGCELLGATGVAFLDRCERTCAEAGRPCVVRDVPPSIARVLDALELSRRPTRARRAPSSTASAL